MRAHLVSSHGLIRTKAASTRSLSTAAIAIAAAGMHATLTPLVQSFGRELRNTAAQPAVPFPVLCAVKGRRLWASQACIHALTRARARTHIPTRTHTNDPTRFNYQSHHSSFTQRAHAHLTWQHDHM